MLYSKKIYFKSYNISKKPKKSNVFNPSRVYFLELESGHTSVYLGKINYKSIDMRNFRQLPSLLKSVRTIQD